jgi:hypothetical protein
VPLFYFDHQENGGEIREDEIGTELRDMAAARVEAVQAAAEWMKDNASESGAALRLIVRGHSPLPLFVLNATIEDRSRPKREYCAKYRRKPSPADLRDKSSR